MRRSGSHAFLNWLSASTQGKVCFLNDVTRFSDITPDQLSYDLPSLSVQKRARVNEKKELLLYNFEDVNLESRADWWLPELLKGTSTNRQTVLLLRDPYNLFASRMKTRDNMPDNEFAINIAPREDALIDAVRSLWLQHAKEFLRLTSILGCEVVRVNYNLWVFDAEYRATIANALGVQSCERAMTQIPRYGFGSSFEGYRNGVLRNRIGLLHRWRHYEDNPHFKQFIMDSELSELSFQIFGSIIEPTE